MNIIIQFIRSWNCGSFIIRVTEWMIQTIGPGRERYIRSGCRTQVWKSHKIFGLTKIIKLESYGQALRRPRDSRMSNTFSHSPLHELALTQTFIQVMLTLRLIMWKTLNWFLELPKLSNFESVKWMTKKIRWPPLYSHTWSYNIHRLFHAPIPLWFGMCLGGHHRQGRDLLKNSVIIPDKGPDKILKFVKMSNFI